MTEVPHFPVRQMVRDAATMLIGQEELRRIPVTTNDIKKLHANQIVYFEMVFGVPPSIF